MQKKEMLPLKSNNQKKARQSGFSLRFLVKTLVFPAGLFILFHTFLFAGIPDKQRFEAEKAKLVGGATKIVDKSASGGQEVNLAKSGQGVTFEKLPEARKLAIRYASVNVGTISVAVNHQQAVKVNVHSSGAITGSFLHAIINIVIPKGAKLDIHIDSSDVALTIDQIIIGNGDLGLPPDIWNLPQLPVAEGQYAADWKAD